MNICNETGNAECQCSYYKAEYSNAIHYSSSDNNPLGVCTSGLKDKLGNSCDPPSQFTLASSTYENKCGAGGTCSALTKKTQVTGLWGYCLEDDLSKPKELDACITWRPGAGAGAGGGGIIQEDPYAGYRAFPGQQWYCVGEETGPVTFPWRYIPDMPYNTGAITGSLSPDDSTENYFQKTLTSGSESDYFYVPVNKNGINAEYAFLDKDINPNLNNATVDEIRMDYYGPARNDNDIEINFEDDDILYGCNDPFSLVFKKGNNVDDYYLTSGSSTFSYTSGSFTYGFQSFSISYLFNNGHFSGFRIAIYGPYSELSDRDSDRPARAYPVAAYVKIKSFKIVLKSGVVCEKLVKIADEYGKTKAYTNRVSWNGEGYKNYDINSQSVDNKQITTQCVPWAATSFVSDDISTLGPVVIKEDTTNSSDLSECFKKDKPAAYEYTSEAELQKLFAKSYDCWQWDNSTGSYNQSCSVWDIPTSASKFSLPEISGIKIDNKSADITSSTPGFYQANLEFYAWANDNQMPIRNITIDWLGNGEHQELMTQSFNDIWVKNHKPNCNDNENSFGDSDKGCRTDSWNFVYDFHCSTGNPGWNSGCPNGVNNACCFKPKISITDNWGKQATSSFDGVIVVYPY